jgi:hypothetical protein
MTASGMQIVFLPDTINMLSTLEMIRARLAHRNPTDHVSCSAELSAGEKS